MTDSRGGETLLTKPIDLGALGDVIIVFLHTVPLACDAYLFYTLILNDAPSPFFLVILNDAIPFFFLSS